MNQYPSVFFLILTVSTCFMVAGCTTSGPVYGGAPVTPVFSPTTQPPMSAPSPTPPSLPPTPVPIAIVTTIAPITSDDITQHFLDLAFGSGNNQLYRLPYVPNINTPRNSISLFNGKDSDLALIQDFVSQFNDLSATNKFSDNIKRGNNADVVIQFVSQDGMDAIPTESYSQEYKAGGVSLAKIGPSTIYINDSLTGDARKHMVLRSLLYLLGFRGDSFRYPDSIFSYQNTTGFTLSLIDQRAIQIMYGAGLHPGMTVADVRNVVYVRL